MAWVPPPDARLGLVVPKGSGSSTACGLIRMVMWCVTKGKEAVLTPREFELLQFLLDHPHRFYTAFTDQQVSPGRIPRCFRRRLRNYVCFG